MGKWDRNGIINHGGIVQIADNNSATVLITVSPACSGCHIEGSCSLSGAIEKSIIVPGDFNLKPGDPVTIIMKQSLGFAAIFLGYILPFIIVLITLIVLSGLKLSELFVGISSIAILVPYFIVLFTFRKYINKKFTLTLKAYQ